MKQCKRWLSLLVAVVMVISMMTMSATALAVERVDGQPEATAENSVTDGQPGVTENSDMENANSVVSGLNTTGESVDESEMGEGTDASTAQDVPFIESTPDDVTDPSLNDTDSAAGTSGSTKMPEPIERAPANGDERTVAPQAETETRQPLKMLEATASSVLDAGHGTDRVIDGQVTETSEFWSSRSLGNTEDRRIPPAEDCAWIQVKLEKSSIVDKVALVPRNWGICFPTGFQFYGSADGEEWTLLKEVSGLTPITTEGTVAKPELREAELFAFDTPMAVRYIRIVGTEYQMDNTKGGFFFQLSEIYVYGEEDPNDPEKDVRKLDTGNITSNGDHPAFRISGLTDGVTGQAALTNMWGSSGAVTPTTPSILTVPLKNNTITASAVVLYPRLAGTDPLHFPSAFKIECLDADGNWQTVKEVTGYQSTSGAQRFEFEPIATKNVRLTFLEVPTPSDNDFRVDLSELEVWGTRSESVTIPIDDATGAAPMFILAGTAHDDDTFVDKLNTKNVYAYYSSAIHETSQVSDGSEFITFQYDKSYKVSGVNLTPHFDEMAEPLAFPTAFRFQYQAKKGGAWQDVPGAVYTEYEANSAVQKFVFENPVEAQAIRLLVEGLGVNADGEYVFELSGARVIGEALPSDARLSVPVGVEKGEAPNYTDPGKDGSMRPSSAVDGNSATFWSSDPESYLLKNEAVLDENGQLALPYTVTLKEATEITRVVLTQRSEGGTLVNFPRAFTLSYSADGENWTEFAAYENYRAVGEQQVFELPQPATAKYIRLVVKKLLNSGAYCQIAEIAAYRNFAAVGEEKAFGEKYYFTAEKNDAGFSSGVSDRKYGDRTLKVGSEGAMAIFANVDFDGAVSIKANFTGYFRNYDKLDTLPLEDRYDWASWEDTALEFYLDNTEGQPIGKVWLDYGDSRVDGQYQEKISALTPGITGRHDLIVRFRDDAGSFEWVQLSTEEAGPNEIAQRKAAYEKKKPDMSAVRVLPNSTWGGTDMLGNKLSTNEGTQSTVDKDKVVGMFFWNWNYGDNFYDGADSPIYDITARNGVPGPMLSAQHWGESVYGHYSALDEWVIRRQGELLADAGVDVIFFDCTNGALTWRSAYLQLLKVWNDMLAEGIQVPKVSFMLPFGMNADNVRSLENLYEQIYQPGLYQECWYYMDGKPLILNGITGATPQYLQDFFSSKPVIATYNNAAPTTTTEAMTWLELYPQNKYTDAKGRSYMSVGVAMNWDGEKMAITPMNGENVIGRSTTRNADGSWNYGPKTADETTLQGLNFQQQWDRAIEEDVDFVFITGWNEWLAGRHPEWAGVKGAIVDTYDTEHSRDIEPSTGMLKDVYYTQLVENIRKLKGMEPVPQEEQARTISIDGSFADWGAAMAYQTYVNDVADRDSVGRGSTHYTNTSGRNDITQAKVAVDQENIYFYVQTADDMVGMRDGGFMQLYINVDRDGATGWEGYDYLLNRQAPGTDTLTLEQWAGNGYSWSVRDKKISYVQKGNEMEIAIPRYALGLQDGDEQDVDLEFKWMDNVIDPTAPDIMDVYTQGDTAPGSRFNYIFKTAVDIDYHQVLPGTAVVGATITSDAQKAAAAEMAEQMKNAQITGLKEAMVKAGIWQTLQENEHVSLRYEITAIQMEGDTVTEVTVDVTPVIVLADGSRVALTDAQLQALNAAGVEVTFQIPVPASFAAVYAWAKALHYTDVIAEKAPVKDGMVDVTTTGFSPFTVQGILVQPPAQPDSSGTTTPDGSSIATPGGSSGGPADSAATGETASGTAKTNPNTGSLATAARYGLVTLLLVCAACAVVYVGRRKGWLTRWLGR